MVKEKIKRFNLEFRKSLGMGVIAAFGLITALAWKDVISEYLIKIESLSLIQGKVIMALIITLISTLVVLIVSKIIPQKE